ncbi:MAG: metallophosphoesterase [Oscillospiraceae bacterium]
MKIVVISDSHKNFEGIYRVFSMNKDADLFIFLGDGMEELEDMQSIYPHKKIWSVAGNCDYFSDVKNTGYGIAENRKILYTHGHTLNVKRGLSTLASFAKEHNAEIVLFGHTHIPMYREENGIHFFNPGSITVTRDGKSESYGIIEISNDGTLSFTHMAMVKTL